MFMGKTNGKERVIESRFMMLPSFPGGADTWDNMQHTECSACSITLHSWVYTCFRCKDIFKPASLGSFLSQQGAALNILLLFGPSFRWPFWLHFGVQREEVETCSPSLFTVIGKNRNKKRRQRWMSS